MEHRRCATNTATRRTKARASGLRRQGSPRRQGCAAGRHEAAPRGKLRVHENLVCNTDLIEMIAIQDLLIGQAARGLCIVVRHATSPFELTHTKTSPTVTISIG